MPSIFNKRDFQKHHIYHLSNRGALGSEIFKSDQDYKTFTFILSYYLRIPEGKPMSYLQTVKAPYTRGATKKLKIMPITCRLISYCLLPNNFHLILEELIGGSSPGISALMKRLSVTYAMFFNQKYGKTGSVFAGKYKMLEVPSKEHLLELTKYLHRLPPSFSAYPHSSYQDYLKITRSWVHPNEVLDHSRTKNTLSYRTFVEDTPPNQIFLGKLLL